MNTQTCQICAEGRGREKHVHFPNGTPKDVQGILLTCRQRHERIRIRYGHTHGPKIGLDWMEEYDVEGTVGLSLGPHQIPLLIHSNRSWGGCSILANCIVRIVASKAPHRVLYSHPNYHRPEIILRSEGDAITAVVGGGERRSFKSVKAAESWKQKMSL